MIGMNCYSVSIARLMGCRRSANPATKRRARKKEKREMTTEEKQYEKAKSTSYKQHSLWGIIKAHPPMYWVHKLNEKVPDVKIRNWAASIIWWAYPHNKTPKPGQMLYEMMDAFRPSVFGRDAELHEAFAALDLPSPVSEKFQPTHPGNQ